MINDINSEAAVLSAMMIDTKSTAIATQLVNESHFAYNSHKLIFNNIKELFDDNIEIDTLTLADRLKRNSDLETVGGISFINELSDVVLSSSNLTYHTDIIIRLKELRDIIEVGKWMVRVAESGKYPREIKNEVFNKLTIVEVT